MMRVRIPGGRLTSEQLRVVAGVATEFGRDVADITDRQNVQYHWIRIEDVPEIWRRLEAVGLSTTEACGDTPRNMLGCPLAGIDADEILDATAVLAEVNAFAEGNKEFSNLPRKWKTAISGCVSHCTVHEINDVSFVGVLDDDGNARFRPVGRRWAVDQPDVRAAARCLRPARPGQGRLGRHHLDLPRLRLPAAAYEGSGQVPDGRLGPGEVP